MADTFEYSATEELYAMEQMVHYNQSIARLVAHAFRSVGVRSGRILDFGAGIGTISVEMRRVEGIVPLALEIDSRQAAVIADRGFQVVSDLDQLQAPLDACFASNVLEHIEDDTGTLRRIHDRLRVGGAIAIYVPAFRLLWTDIDAYVGHFRRYTRQSLRDALQAAGFRVVRTSYCDSLGFATVLILKLLGSRRKAETKNNMQFYDRYVLPLSLAIDRIGASHFLGKNVFALAIKE